MKVMIKRKLKKQGQNWHVILLKDERFKEHLLFNNIVARFEVYGIITIRDGFYIYPYECRNDVINILKSHEAEKMFSYFVCRNTEQVSEMLIDYNKYMRL